MSLIRALRWRPFALLWSGQTVSRFGDAVHSIALAWLVLQSTGSAAAMGIVLTAQLLPFLVLSLAGGVVVDRVPRLRVMVVADLVRMALVATIAALIFLHAVEIWHLGVLAAFSGLVQAFAYPAYAAAVPELVPSAARPSANALYQLSNRLSRLAGPAAGAALVALGGTAAAFALDALTFGVSACLLVLAIRGMPKPAVDRESNSQRPKPSAMGELRDGLTTVSKEPRLWVAILMAGVTGITLAGPLEAALPLLVADHLHGGVQVLGLIESMIAVGAIVAAIFLGSRARLRWRGPGLYVAWIALAIGVSAVGLPIGIGGVAAAAVVIGACGAIVGLVWANTLQDIVPPERLGRVSSIDALGSSALEPVGYVLSGAAADVIGPAAVFVAGGLLSAGVLSLALLHPAVRRLD